MQNPSLGMSERRQLALAQVVRWSLNAWPRSASVWALCACATVRLLTTSRGDTRVTLDWPGQGVEG